jgi:uncharacterized protein YndB with AHSA1/START domain
MSYELRVERVIAAPPEEVFDAFTGTEAQRVWMRAPDDPDGILETESDPRVGGRWVAVWGPSRDELYRETNLFEVVDRPHRLVMATTSTAPDGTSLETSTEVLFEEREGGTRMTVIQRGFPTAELRDYFETTAWAGALAMLDRFIGVAPAAGCSERKESS